MNHTIMCPDCCGSGTRPVNHIDNLTTCYRCDGKGEIDDPETITITIPRPKYIHAYAYGVEASTIGWGSIEDRDQAEAAIREAMND